MGKSIFQNLVSSILFGYRLKTREGTGGGARGYAWARMRRGAGATGASAGAQRAFFICGSPNPTLLFRTAHWEP